MRFVGRNILRNASVCGVIAGLCIVMSGCGDQEAPPTGQQWPQQEETQPAQPEGQESTSEPQGGGPTSPMTPTE